LRQSRSYGALHETHRQVDEEQSARAPEQGPPERKYDALRETERLVEEQRHSPPPREIPAPPPAERYYGALRETQHQLDERQAEEPDRPVRRTWTHHGGMVPQQHSAIIWNKQNIESKMADNDKPGTERAGEGTQPGRDQNDPELQQALAAVEDAKRREAAERARQQERDRGGPER
jgi:hypothetical protein